MKNSKRNRVLLTVSAIFISVIIISTCFGSQNGQNETIDYEGLREEAKRLGIQRVTIDPKSKHPNEKSANTKANGSPSKLFGMIAAYASVYPKEFETLLSKHDDVLSHHEFRQYTEGIATAFETGAVRMLSDDQIESVATKIATSNGAPHLGLQLAEQGRQRQLDILAVGNALREFSQICGGEVEFESTIWGRYAAQQRISKSVLDLVDANRILQELFGLDTKGPAFMELWKRMLFNLLSWQWATVAESVWPEQQPPHTAIRK